MATLPREDGDEALQRCQDALYRRLTPLPPREDGRGTLRVFIWTADDARLAPDMAQAFEALEAGHRMVEAAIPADDPGATHSACPTAILEVTRLEPAARTGRGWHALVPCPLDELRDACAPGASDRDRHWLLDTLERQVRECFWETAYGVLDP